MAGEKLEPHLIDTPMKLLAAWFTCLVILSGIFLTAASQLKNPDWLPPMLAISACGFVVIFVVCVFLMQTVFRPEMMQDQEYRRWLKQQKEKFDKFAAENKATPSTKPASAVMLRPEPGDRRGQRYQQTRGLFLVHSWRASRTPGQVADVIIQLHQHRQGPLTEGVVDSVEYDLGPKFFGKPVTKKNSDDNFRLKVSAYGPMLCLATVRFSDGAEPIQIERYIDFDPEGLA